MRILFLAHRIPYPPNKGDKIRSFNEIRYLSHQHEIHLVCLADSPHDLKYKNSLKKYCKSVNVVLINPLVSRLKAFFYLLSKKPLSVPYFYTNQIQRIINKLISTVTFDVILCFSSPVAEYVFSAMRHKQLPDASTLSTIAHEKVAGSPKLIMDFVDVDSDKWLQYSRYTGFPFSWLYRLESRRLAKYEKKIAMTFNHSIFVSEKEVELFKKQNPGIVHVTAVPNGVDMEYFDEEIKRNTQSSINNESSGDASHGRKPVLIFTGAMDYYANVDGVDWFCKEIFPEIKQRFPSVQFYIVGNRPHKKVWTLMKNEGIVVTGYVKDIRKYYRKADLCVIPLRIARGIQNKILEAMAFGIPVIATPQAFAGIKAVPGRDIELATNAEEFIVKVNHILGDEKLKKYLGGNGKKIVGDFYNWSENIGILESILADKIQKSFKRGNGCDTVNTDDLSE